MQQLGRMDDGGVLVKIEPADQLDFITAAQGLSEAKRILAALAAFNLAGKPAEVEPEENEQKAAKGARGRTAVVRTKPDKPAQTGKANVRDMCVLVLQASSEPLTAGQIADRFKTQHFQQRSNNPKSAISVCLAHYPKIFKAVGTAPGKGKPKLYTLKSRPEERSAGLPGVSPPAAGDRKDLIRARLAKLSEKDLRDELSERLQRGLQD